MKKCINRTKKTQKSATEKKIIEVSNEILSLRLQRSVNGGRKKEVNNTIAKLEKQLTELKALLVDEKKGLNRLYKSKELLDRVTKDTYSCILKISRISPKILSKESEKQLKLFLLLHEFLAPALEYYITENAKDLGVKAVVDSELIDEVALT